MDLAPCIEKRELVPRNMYTMSTFYYRLLDCIQCNSHITMINLSIATQHSRVGQLDYNLKNENQLLDRSTSKSDIKIVSMRKYEY